MKLEGWKHANEDPSLLSTLTAKRTKFLSRN